MVPLVSFPLMRSEINKVIEALKPVSPEIVSSISLKAKTICKCCVFHNDNCLINMIFIAFKSAEIKRNVEFKDMRPNIRIVF